MVAIPKMVGPVSDRRENTSLVSVGHCPPALPGYKSDSFLSPRKWFIFRSGLRSKHSFVNEWHEKWRAGQDRSAPQMRLEEGSW
jgi:hypothetical protein